MNEKLTVQISADIKQLQDELKKAGYELKKFDGEQAKAGSSNPFKNLNNSIKGLIGAYIGLQAAQSLVNRAFNESLQLDSISAAYNQIFKNSELATLQLERLKGKADELGLSFLDLASSYKTFAGAAYTTGLSLKDTNKIFDAVANASAQMKLNSEQTQGTLNALAQMIGKGTVSMEELRQQLGERLPSAMKIFADGLGVSVEELNKMIASGKVMANDALPKFADRLNEVYGATKPVKGLQGAINDLSNTFTKAVQEGAIGKFFTTIIEGATAAIGVIERAYKGFQVLVNNSKFQANESFKSLLPEINKSFEVGGKKGIQELNNFIQRYSELTKAVGGSTEKGQVYLELIKIARAAQAELVNELNNTSKAGIKTGETIADLKKQLENLILSYESTQIGTKEFYNLGKAIDEVKKKLENLNNQQLAKQMKFAPDMGSQLETSLSIDLSPLNEATKDITDFQAQTNLLTGNFKEIEQIGGQAFTAIQLPLTQTNELTKEQVANIENMVQLLGGALTSAFDAALINGQNFAQVLMKAIGDLIKRLIAAVATAAILTAILNTFTAGGAAAVGGFSGILKGLTGFNFGGAGASGNRIASVPQIDAGGSVSFEIRGDKLYGVLQNYNQRLNLLA